MRINLDEPWNTELKRTIVNFSQDLKELKEDRKEKKKNLSDLKEERISFWMRRKGQMHC